MLLEHNALGDHEMGQLPEKQWFINLGYTFENRKPQNRLYGLKLLYDN